MTNNHTTVEQSTAMISLSVEEKRWATVLMLDAQISTSSEAFRLRMKTLKAEYIALLPYASPAQAQVIVDAALYERDLDEDARPNVLFRLTPEQENAVSQSKDRRKANLAENKAGHMASVMADEDMKLVSYKVKVGPSKTTVSARFEKATSGKAKAKLMALLATAREERKAEEAAAAAAAAAAP